MKKKEISDEGSYKILKEDFNHLKQQLNDFKEKNKELNLLNKNLSEHNKKIECELKSKNHEIEIGNKRRIEIESRANFFENKENILTETLNQNLNEIKRKYEKEMNDTRAIKDKEVQSINYDLKLAFADLNSYASKYKECLKELNINKELLNKSNIENSFLKKEITNFQDEITNLISKASENSKNRENIEIQYNFVTNDLKNKEIEINIIKEEYQKFQEQFNEKIKLYEGEKEILNQIILKNQSKISKYKNKVKYLNSKFQEIKNKLHLN